MPQVFAEELKSIPMSPNLGESLERAHRFARDQSHRFVMLEHLLLALAEDPEASLILHSANVDLPRLGTDVSGYLGGLMEDMRSDGSTEPRPDGELLRVLQAAASAAQQSKRRQIDGAIVLAAIVGDGKSPAAGLLKTHGMTFEEAIRALQRANTKARLKPIPKPAPGASPAAAPPPPEPELAPPPRDAEPPPSAVAEVRSAIPDRATAAAQPAPPVADEAPGEPVEPASQPARPPVQSADDILAAARARIQKRTASLNRSIEAQAPAGIAEGRLNGSAHAEPASPTGQMSSAMRDLLAASSPAPAAPAPRPQEAAHGPREAFNGASHQPADLHPFRPEEAPAPLPAPAAPAHAAAPMMVPPRARGAQEPMPAMQRAPGMRGPQGPGPVSERPQPPPPWPGPVAGPAPGMPGPMHAPMPGPQAPGAPPQAPVDPRQLKRASAPLPSFPAGPQAKQQRKGAPPERGPLVESIPRRMKLFVTSSGEVRIARDKIDGFVQALSARSDHGPGEPVVARALSVRLRSPTDSFYLEPVTAETQWLEAGPHLAHSDALGWRWSITPKARGKGRLVLQLSMRTVGLDGASEELAAPDRVIDVKVRGRAIRKLLGAMGYIALLAIAVGIGRFGGELGPMLRQSIKYVTGL